MDLVRIIVALVIFAIWVAAYILSFLNPDYQVPNALLPVMMVAVGYLLGPPARDFLARWFNTRGQGGDES
jgi:hypothetical protein